MQNVLFSGVYVLRFFPLKRILISKSVPERWYRKHFRSGTFTCLHLPFPVRAWCCQSNLSLDGVLDLKRLQPTSAFTFPIQSIIGRQIPRAKSFVIYNASINKLWDNKSKIRQSGILNYNNGQSAFESYRRSFSDLLMLFSKVNWVAFNNYGGWYY